MTVKNIKTIFVSDILLILIFYCHYIMCFGDEFGTCLKSNPSPSLKTCFGQQLIQSLNNFETVSDFEISEGIVFEKDDTVMSRSVPNFLEQDPLDYRSILENAGIVMGQRSLRIDMKRIYPGLFLRIGPTVGVTGPNLGMVEFVMDPNRNRNDRIHQTEGESTARIMTRQFVVPFLLGVKFNLATLMPIIIGLIALLSKKALFLLKIAFMLSTFFGYGGLNTGGYGGHHTNYLNSGYNPYQYGTHQGIHQGVYEDNLYKESEALPLTDNFYEFDKKQQLKDKDIKTYARAGRSLMTNGYRTFTWQSKQH